MRSSKSKLHPKDYYYYEEEDNNKHHEQQQYQQQQYQKRKDFPKQIQRDYYYQQQQQQQLQQQQEEYQNQPQNMPGLHSPFNQPQQFTRRLNSLLKSAPQYKTKSGGVMQQRSPLDGRKCPRRVLVEDQPIRVSDQHQQNNSESLMFLSNTTNNQEKYDSQRHIDGESPQFAKKFNKREQTKNCTFSNSETPMPRTQVPAPHYLEHAPGKRDFDSKKKASSQNQTPSNASRVSSIRSMTHDAEFVEFLKNIVLYCTGEEQDDQQIKIGVFQSAEGESPASSSSNNLFKNLNFLKECYQKYKQNRTRQSNVLGKSSNSIKHSPMIDNIQSDRCALPRQPSWGTKQRWRIQQEEKQKMKNIDPNYIKREQQKQQSKPYSVTPQIMQSVSYTQSSKMNPGVFYSPSPFTTQQNQHQQQQQQQQQQQAVQYIVNPYAYPTLGQTTSSTSSLLSGGQQIKQQQMLVPQPPILFVTPDGMIQQQPQQQQQQQQHSISTIYPPSYVQSPSIKQMTNLNSSLVKPSTISPNSLYDSASSNGMVAAHQMIMCQKTPEKKRADRNNLQYIDSVYDVVINQNRPYFQGNK